MRCGRFLHASENIVCHIHHSLEKVGDGGEAEYYRKEYTVGK